MPTVSCKLSVPCEHPLGTECSVFARIAVDMELTAAIDLDMGLVASQV